MTNLHNHVPSGQYVTACITTLRDMSVSRSQTRQNSRMKRLT